MNDIYSLQEDERRIYHFHFKAWPDHGVPNDPGCVLNFLHDVNAKHESIEMASPASKKVRSSILGCLNTMRMDTKFPFSFRTVLVLRQEI